MNLVKCEVSFSKSLSQDIIQRVSAELAFKTVSNHDKYLGLPTLFKRLKKISLSGIKDRIWKKLQGWKEKLLSKARKEILIKSVAHSLPTYAMSYFKLSSNFCDEVEKIIRNFWWGTSNSERWIPWLAWKQLCRKKKEGGLGFRDLKAFSDALLAKQFWSLHLYPNSLLARSLKARYFPKTTLWVSTAGFNPSLVWRSSWSSRSTLNLGVRWRVGNGESINIWQDAWLGKNGLGKIISSPRGLDVEANVASLIDFNNKCWRMEVINEVFLRVDVEHIRKVPISTTMAPDARVWAASVDGVFCVRVAYSLALDSQEVVSCSSECDRVWMMIWSLPIPPKAKISLWRASWDILPLGANLWKKVIKDAELCRRCGLLEGNNHILMECSWPKSVWANTNVAIPGLLYSTFRELLGAMCHHKQEEEISLIGVCAWQIWCARNDLYFEKTLIDPVLCFKRAVHILAEYTKAINGVKRDSPRKSSSQWCAPDRGTIKVNVDAAINEINNKIGLGVVARNEDGAVLFAASKTHWPFVSVEYAELEAIQWAVDLLKARS